MEQNLLYLGKRLKPDSYYWCGKVSDKIKLRSVKNLKKSLNIQKSHKIKFNTAG